jgi:tetraacyldisaccharide 4'-kinase
MPLFRTPAFWYKQPSFFQKIILKPISSLYSYISTKNYKKDYQHKSSGAKVIAVGGITVGGSGKTMVVQSICEILKSKNRKVAVLSRGFGRLTKETLLVDNKIHSHREVGDEPLLLSHTAPVYVGKNRFESSKLAEAQEGFEFLVLDDGITQKSLEPDVKLIVIDREQRLGNGEMFPLGPNRLNFEKIKADINGIIILGKKGKSFINVGDIPVFYGEIQQDFSHLKKRIVAFCGIGYPDKFFNSLVNFEVMERVIFPDHYPFSSDDLEKLHLKAKHFDAQLVTTEKDFMRIPPEYRNSIATVPVRIIWKTPFAAAIDF